MSKTLEGMNAAHERGYAESWDSNPAIHSSVTKHLAYYDANAAAMLAALLVFIGFMLGRMYPE